MGCGGSRTDALEPRYLESWTKETESTWLTSTDTDMPLSSIHSMPSETSEAVLPTEKATDSDIFDDGLPAPAQAYLKVCSTMSEASLHDVKGGGSHSIVASQEQKRLPSSPGTMWQDNRMSTKHVTITVTQTVRQVDKSGKIKEKSNTTFEVMKPRDRLKEAEADSDLK